MSEILAKIGFDWQIALANIINFALVFLLLHKIVFKKIAAHLRERRDIIARGLEDAQKAETSLVMAHQERDEMISNAERDAHDIRNQAQLTARQTLQQLDSQQQDLLAQYKDREKNALQLLQQQDLAEFQQRAGQTVTGLAERLFRDAMSNSTVAREHITSLVNK